MRDKDGETKFIPDAEAAGEGAAEIDLDADSEMAADPENEAERLLAQRLMEGEPEREAPEEEAVKRLSPKWEIRIQTSYDPVAEETALYRSMAKEVDDRYDRRRRKPEE